MKRRVSRIILPLRIYGILAIFLLLSCLPACEGRYLLRENVAVISLHPYLGYIGLGETSSSLVFVDSNGSLDILRSGPMAGQIPVWNHDKVYYIDQSKDYIISNYRVKKIKADKGYLQTAAAITSNDGFVSFLDLGNAGDGNRVQIVFNNGAETISRDLYSSAMRVSSSCGDDIYAISQESSATHYGRASLVLHRLGDADPYRYSSYGKSLRTDFNIVPASAPCVSGKIFFLGNFDVTQSESKPRLAIWDTRDKRLSFKEIKFDGVSSSLVKMLVQDFPFVDMANTAESSSLFICHETTGAIFSIDIFTGTLKEVTPPIITSRAGEHTFMFQNTRSRFYILEKFFSDDNVMLKLAFYEKSSLEKRHTIASIHGDSFVQGSSDYDVSFAVNPLY